jgi:3-deoxy-7-phosphoheptulonate synthase
MDIVEDVKRIQEPYKNVNRKFHPDDTVVDIAPGVKIGGGNFQVMAGPCSVEESDQVLSIARAVKAAGACILRGGAFKPRTSPYAFQGLGAQGIEILKSAKKEVGIPLVSEIMDISKLPLFEDVDIIQVGARNMQNFELLKELGKTKKPILLKRGLSSTIQELLMSAEYIMVGGNSQIILCERGIRTFETATRNTLDISAVPVLKELTHLPVIVDPSHGTGNARFVKPMAMAAVAAGADGLIIEVHNDPVHALCDGAQSLTPESFGDLMAQVNKILPFAYRR